MRIRRTLLAAALLAAGCASNGGTAAPAGTEGGATDQEKPAGAQAGPSPEEMEAWMKYMTPGDPHKRMAEHEGEWTVTGKMWMDPSAPATDSAGTAKIRMMFGGRYQVQEYSGSFMGMPFEGFGVSAYDNALKEFVNVWFDSMGTGLMVARGKEDANGLLTCSGEMVDPSGNKCTMREVMTARTKDSFTFEMWVKDSKHPEEYKCMELNYTRRK